MTPQMRGAASLHPFFPFSIAATTSEIRTRREMHQGGFTLLTGEALRRAARPRRGGFRRVIARSGLLGFARTACPGLQVKTSRPPSKSTMYLYYEGMPGFPQA
ncbi:uncharacterized protein LOC119305740 [Triticum dicoccoides]|uniref:uncharacterized protein LOC119305740 n=1 Tax=Triticum dicoccoides TaxID=85692 RepID=UPI00188DE944|nr:uncharacterized protein LOC119305740 [Triticum dicoccoides]